MLRFRQVLLYLALYDVTESHLRHTALAPGHLSVQSYRLRGAANQLKAGLKEGGRAEK